MNTIILDFNIYLTHDDAVISMNNGNLITPSTSWCHYQASNIISSYVHASIN